MRFATTDQNAVIRKYVDVHDAPAQGHRFLSRRFIPQRATLVYQRDASRKAWTVFSIRISGVYAKKDGTPSGTSFERGAPVGFTKEPEWSWLVRLADILRPSESPRAALDLPHFEGDL